MKKIISLLLAATLLSSCTAASLYNSSLNNSADVTDSTEASRLLAGLPLPKKAIPVSVYNFQDQTGQFKYNDVLTDYSRAVTKGGLAVLTKALLDTGNGNWFMVAERNGLNNLLQERQLIRTMRNTYTRADGVKLGDLPPLVYAGMIIEGGIIFYDSNTLTGGAAAGYFGLTGSAQYHRDIVTVYLRAVNVSTGQVLLSVNSSKTVFSYAVDAGVTRYLSIDKLLEVETGFSVNEPGQLAVRQAIETGVYSLIMEGVLKGTWSFADEAAGQQAVAAYLARRDGPHSNGFPSNNTHAMATPASAPQVAYTRPVMPVYAAASAEETPAPAPASQPVATAAPMAAPAAVAYAAPAPVAPPAAPPQYTAPQYVVPNSSYTTPAQIVPAPQPAAMQSNTAASANSNQDSGGMFSWFKKQFTSSDAQGTVVQGSTTDATGATRLLPPSSYADRHHLNTDSEQLSGN